MLRPAVKYLACLGLIAAALMLIGPSAARAAEMKIGYVEMQRVLDLTDRGKQIMRDLAAKKDELELKEQTMKLDIMKMEDDLRKTGEALSEQALQERVGLLEKKYYEYQQFVSTAQMQFEGQKINALKGFIQDIQTIAAQVAGEQGYAIILLKVEDVFTESSIILFADPAYDLTDEVVRRINSRGSGQK
ncbi:MAG: OmpH family outer membrane protein [Candidatus Alcyoniella australis]|nr:OmpH family outer membrane protein [Candidatus Alcyoniella australis]